MADADRNHDLAGNDLFAIVEDDAEPRVHSIDSNNQLILKFGYKSLLEFQPVSDEGFERNGQASVSIGKSALAAIVAKGKRGFRVVKRRCEALRLQLHAVRHLRFTCVHGGSKNTEVESQRFEMCSD